MEKCLIAMSGGVDSSVAAMLMQQQGYACVGGTMLLHNEGADPCPDAQRVAEQLNIPFCAFDCRDAFRGRVMGDFARCYAAGRTPNPCVQCNRHLKFDSLLKKAMELGCQCLATGHYARVQYDPGRGRWLLKRALDLTKDQSYFLYCLTQEQLSKVRFPLGELTKPEIRRLAEESGIVTAEKKDSQDICFIPDGDYAEFLRRFTGMDWTPGDFVDADGRVLGTHRGIIHYTVGQRRGLGIPAAEPLYVIRICPEENTVVLGPDSALYSRELTASGVNLIAVDRVGDGLRCMAKIRYRQTPAPATVTQTDEDTLRVVFDEPQRAITAGQSVVLYQDDLVLGGGVIER